MFLRASKRLKDGKEHYYWSIVENKRVTGGKIVQRHVLYLGEINDSQREAWRKTIEIFEDGKAHPRTVALFPHERIAPTPEEKIFPPSQNLESPQTEKLVESHAVVQTF